MLIGYARVSTQEQDLSMQVEALRAAGCERVYEEKISGSRFDRPQLTKALSDLSSGDTLVVWKLDRLGRTVKGLINIVSDLDARQVQFKSLTDSIDTSSASGRFFFNVMASLAQVEREITQERVKAGLLTARAAGRVGGRKLLMTDSKKKAAIKLLEAGTAPKDVAKNLGFSLKTLYRHIPANG